MQWRNDNFKILNKLRLVLHLSTSLDPTIKIELWSKLSSWQEILRLRQKEVRLRPKQNFETSPRPSQEPFDRPEYDGEYSKVMPCWFIKSVTTELILSPTPSNSFCNWVLSPPVPCIFGLQFGAQISGVESTRHFDLLHHSKIRQNSGISLLRLLKVVLIYPYVSVPMGGLFFVSV